MADVIADHPLRGELNEVMHQRSLPPIKAPCRLQHWLVLIADEDRPREAQTVARWRTRFEGHILFDSAMRLLIDAGGRQLQWDRHTEFSTLTVIEESPFDDPFADDLLPGMAAEMLGALPGQLFRSVQIAVRPRTLPEPGPARTDALFAPHAPLSCYVSDGGARIWSDMRVGPHGYTRMLVQDIETRGNALARAVQRLIEAGNYRKLALLGFPQAQKILPLLTTQEHLLANITDRIRSDSAHEDQLLADILDLAGAVEHGLAENNFRQGATQAYFQLTRDRLTELQQRKIPGFMTLSEFADRRLVPAMRTCEVAARRQAELSRRVAKAADLVRTRISLSLERQNQTLLKRMNERVRLQNRLQAAVEHLSVFAVSYYLIGLVAYMLDGGGSLVPWIANKQLKAALVPLVLLGVWLVIRSVRRRAIAIERQHDEGEGAARPLTPKP
ncbi:MAG: DUF3422 family protein [Alphaproteobacteria bacterium]|nr:MAG: DUF3422 family protein [Alphaproteobacteria bacterium]